MLAFSDIIDFLLRLLTDDAARAEFEQDPQGALERAGLEGVTGQDIRDARLQLADSGAVSAVDDGPSSTGSSYLDGDDPVREIGYTTQHYTADESVRQDGDDSDPADLTTVVTIDDRDTLFFQTFSDDDVSVTDNSVTITDSLNEDNSVTDVTAIQVTDSFNSDDDVTIDAANSFNSEDSFNTDDDVVAIQDNDVNPSGDEVIAVDTGAPADDLAAVSGPAAPDADDDAADVADEPADDAADADLAPDDSDALVL